jgi:DNA polymerase-3 subunit beta
MLILTGIKFEAKDDLLIVTATDLEMGIKCAIPASVIEPGTVVLPSRYITELIRRLPDVPVIFRDNQEKGSVIIRYLDSEASINSFPEDEYPEVELPDMINAISVKESVFREAVRKVIFAIASDDNRAAINGALFVVNGSTLELVATDLHRLAWCKIELDYEVSQGIQVLIPGRALSELSKIIGSSDNNISITVTENNVLFTLENISFVSRLLNGKFPKYQHVIPKKVVTRVRIKTKELVEATERAALFSTEEQSSIKIIIQDSELIITDVTVAGQVYEEMSAELNGEEMEIGFNAHYLNDLLKVINSEETDIEFFGSYSPGVFRPVGDNNYFSLILPVQVKT